MWTKYQVDSLLLLERINRKLIVITQRLSNGSTSVILLTGGGVLSQHALQVVSQPALQQVSRGVCSGGGVSAPRGVSAPGVCVWPSVVVFCYALLWPSGLVAFWLRAAFWYGLLGGPEGHNRRPPHQKATTERGCLVETPPQDSYCCGRYASYWNAFLFYL